MLMQLTAPLPVRRPVNTNLLWPQWGWSSDGDEWQKCGAFHVTKV